MVKAKVLDPRNSPSISPLSQEGVSGGPGSRSLEGGSMDDVCSVGSSHGRSSHSSHSRHSYKSSASRHTQHSNHSNQETGGGGGGGAHGSSDQRTPRERRHHTRSRSQVVECTSPTTTAPTTPTTTGGNRVDKTEIASMYLDTKQNMLEIIEEGLHMKLELKNIKQQFLSLLENFESYQNQPAVTTMKASPGVPLAEKALSTPRARVRALYDARRARIQSRRSLGSNTPAGTAPRRSLRRAASARAVEEDKENAGRAIRRLRADEKTLLGSDQKYGDAQLKTSTPFCKPHRHCACHPRTTPSQLLTPIQEERSKICKNHFSTSSGFNTGTTSPTLSELEGEYVTLRSPSQEGVVSMEVDDNYMDVNSTPSSALYASKRTSVSDSVSVSNKNDQTSIWINSIDNLGPHCPRLSVHLDSSNKENIGGNVINSAPSQSSRRRESPVKYATSDAISELYTSRSLSNLKDVSQISSNLSHNSLREQSSGSNISGNLHSTFNYPLHSTLNYPLHSTLNMSRGDPLRSPDVSFNEPDFKCMSDARTTISEPSAVLRKKGLSSTTKKPKTPRSVDDSLVDIRSLQKPDSIQSTELSASAQSRRSRSRSARTRRRERLKQKEREAQLTPTSHKEPKLCKEHGLHPTFGGPCIFQTDDSFSISDSTTESEEEVRPRSSTAVTETDNDSSYLSECMDDSSHFSTANARAEDYTAMYDARNGRMRMLKRQTGQTVLDKTQLRDPIGLSESDFLDVTRKHLSLEATRSSLPDLSALSTTTSEADDPEADISEDTLHASQMALETSMKESDGFWSPNSLDDTIVSSDRHSLKQRPLSVSTSTTTSTTDNTSPESTESRDLPVPVNSPNVTDSGSSRPTTDTYDYVDVPKFEIMGPPVSLPPRYQNPPPRRRNLGVRPPCTVGKQAPAPPPAPSTSSQELLETRSEGRSARKCLRYAHDYDSGFSTPGSGRRTTDPGKHIMLQDNAGNTRTVVQHSAVARNLQHDRKKQLVKKIKQFSSNFYKSTGNLHIHTLGHF